MLPATAFLFTAIAGLASRARAMRSFAACLCTAVTASVSAFELAVVSYNVESDADTTAEQVAEDIARIPTSHLWALSEVNARDFETYRAAVGQEYAIIQGSTGGSDRLAIVYDPSVLAPIAEPVELSAAGGSRHPLLARFRITAAGHEVLVVATHLQRGNAQTRQAQARWLNQWTADLTDVEAPPAVLLLGDFNFDVEPDTETGNRAYQLFLEGDHFRWIRPACLDHGTCPPTGTGCNPRYTSILDFVFLAGAATAWSATAQILFQDDDAYCDMESKGGSDHRPVRALISLPIAQQP